MIQALGYHIRRVFVGVFMAGTALAGMGGMMWAQYQAVVGSQIGDSMTILVFIILIIGGLGSVGGCFIGAILVGLTSNYVALPGAENGAGIEHSADGADPVVAAARIVSDRRASLRRRWRRRSTRPCRQPPAASLPVAGSPAQRFPHPPAFADAHSWLSWIVSDDPPGRTPAERDACW